MKATLVVPTLNEIVGMKTVMPLVDRSLFRQIIVVDGRSTDGTAEWARDNGYDVVVQSRPGFRFAYMEIMDRVAGDVIVTFSPDGNCLPELLGPLLDKMAEGHDMVIVSRYLDDAHSDDDDMVTAFGNWLFTTTINVLHGGRYTDALGIYRAYRTRLIRELDLDKDEGHAPFERLFSTRISWEPLMSVRAAKRGLRIGEIPGDEPARIDGERKLQVIRWGGAYYLQVWRELFFWK